MCSYAQIPYKNAGIVFNCVHLDIFFRMLYDNSYNNTPHLLNCGHLTVMNAGIVYVYVFWSYFYYTLVLTV